LENIVTSKIQTRLVGLNKRIIIQLYLTVHIAVYRCFVHIDISATYLTNRLFCWYRYVETISNTQQH